MRRPHRKTRTGCTACKARRIKCDETKPACKSCSDRQVACTYPPVRTSSSSQSGPSTSNNPKASSQSTLTFSDSPRDDNVSSLKSPMEENGSSLNSQILTMGTAPRPSPNLNMLHLELLHHFTTSTCYSLYTSDTLRTFWRIQIPRLAFSYDFVMHALLALSALHLALNSEPPRKAVLIAEARSLHQNGLRVATAILPHASHENCAALWIFNSITSLVSFASPRLPGDMLIVGGQGIADRLQLLRGTRYMIMIKAFDMFNGALSPLFAAGQARRAMRAKHASDCTTESKHLSDLQKLVESPDPRGPPIPPEHLEAYRGAIDKLRLSFNVSYAPGFQTYEAADVFVWLFEVSDLYMELLTEKTPESLVIFAHFCIVLKRFDSMWYMAGWYKHWLGQIYEMLDEEHKLWIRWPIEETGMVLY